MLSHDFPFDTVQMPLNCLDATFRSFETAGVAGVAEARDRRARYEEHGGKRRDREPRSGEPEEALRYAMSLPVATTISGMESMDVLEQNLAIARASSRCRHARCRRLRDRVKYWAADGRFERFKTTKMYDGAEGRKQHEYPPMTELPA